MIIASKSNIYTVSLLFRSLRDGIFLSTNLWEESLVLIRAPSKEDAEEKACQIARSRRVSYKTDDGVELTWEFFKIERVFEVDGTLENGAEVFSRHLRNAEVESLLTAFDE